MRLISFNPMKDWFDGSYDPFFGSRFRSRAALESDIAVRMDLIENDNEYRIVAEIPGIDREDIALKVENGVLTISGERKHSSDDDKSLIWSERFHGRFSRSFRLEESIDAGKISAEYKNGILEVRLPLKEETKPRQIEIKVN